MKENVSGYSRNPCSLNRERDAAFAAKLLTLPTGDFSAEKSEEHIDVFASIRRRRENVKAASAPSANEFV